MESQLEEVKLVPDHQGGRRLDQIAASCFPDYSRSRLQQWIVSGNLRVDGELRRCRDKLVGGELLTLQAECEESTEWAAENIPLDILYEDDDIAVINKPEGLVVHPAPGNRSGTLLNGLLCHCPGNRQLPRGGIVHRLDKGTSGLMVVAKTFQAHSSLVSQLQRRSVSRHYQAVVCGVVASGGTVDKPIGRHPVNRLRMAVVADGKPSITHYRVVRRYVGHTHIICRLSTGRTHQIRVHMSQQRHPLVGDTLYGGRPVIPKHCTQVLRERLERFQHQALHAGKLGLCHPKSGASVEWNVSPPNDFLELIDALQQHADEMQGGER